MIKYFIIGLLSLVIKAEDNSRSCRIDKDDYNNTYIYCYYLKVDDPIPLPSEMTHTSQMSLNLIECTGKITESSFSNLRDLTSISMVDTKLDELIFPNLPNLTYLQIHNSELPTLVDAFKNVKALTGLTLIRNKGQLDDNSFRHLTSLEQLHITGQEIQLTKPLLKDLKALVDLRISGSNLEEIPAVFQENSKLISLHLGENPIKTIEQGALDPLKNLKTLDLIPSDLQKFDVNFVKELKLLQYLGVPARSVKYLDVAKLLEYCPEFSGFFFLQNDSSCPEVMEVREKIFKLKPFSAIIFSGLSEERTC